MLNTDLCSETIFQGFTLESSELIPVYVRRMFANGAAFVQ